MNTEKWNEICFLLSENIKKDISENEFEQKVIQALGVLGWKEYSGDFDIRPSFKIGAANSITPDFVIKSDKKEKLFVIEIKQPQLPINSGFQKQLFSYLRQLKLEYGILIGNKIQIFYDEIISDREEPLLIDEFCFERNSEIGIRFVEVFSKNNFSKESLNQYTLNRLEEFKQRINLLELKKKILSQDFKLRINELIKKDLSNEYDQEIIETILTEIQIHLESKEESSKKSDRFSFKAKETINNKPYKRGTQTKLIRDLLSEKSTREEIILALANEFNKTISWARNRIKSYEGDYGPMGINDPKLIQKSLTTQISQSKY